jgi:hypothetical protein
MKSLWRVLITVFVFVVSAGIVTLLYIFSGTYNIAASVPHSAATEKLLDWTLERSIENHSRSVSVPAGFDGIDYEEGFPHYDGMCVDCHGAPGIGRSEFGQGLYPLGPKLSRKVSEADDEDILSPSELFWVVKNGIKMTGMPAFGKTHQDEEIWRIVAFLERLPDLSFSDYIKMQDSGSFEEEDSEESEH